MFLFPYRVDFELPRWPAITIAICIFCVFVFIMQLAASLTINKSATQFCAYSVGGSFSFVLQKIAPHSNELDTCVQLISTIHSSNQPNKVILRIAQSAAGVRLLEKNQNVEFLAQSLQDLYKIYNVQAPASLTAELMYDPGSFNPLKMMSSVFAHSGWLHLLFNLLFFFAFAAAVEITIGRLYFAGLIVALALITNVCYSLVMLGQESALPTLGLSGVVMGIIGIFIVLMPNARIRCLFWFVVFIRRFSIPAWIIAVWCLAWDILQLSYSYQQSGVNLIAHISGAMAGIGFGVWLLKKTPLGLSRET